MLSESAVSGAGGRLGRVETTHRLRRIGLEAGRFETLPLQIVDGIEVRIDGRKRHLVLDAQSRDPEVVLWNRLALLPESEAQFSVNLGGGDRDVQDDAASHQRFNLGEVLAGFPRIEGAVAQFTDDGCRQQVLADAREQADVNGRS